MRAQLQTLALSAVLCCPASAALADGGPIMPLSQVHAGMDCTGETVIQGTAISSFNVHVIDIVQDPAQGPRILVRVSGPAVDTTGVAEGFSGSPVYCDDGTGTLRNAGAISAGIGEYGNKVALVTPIELMLGERVKPPSSAPRLSVRSRPLLGPLTVGGLSPALLALLQRAGERVGRTVVAAPAGSTTSFGVQPLVPGASVAAAYSSGAIQSGAIGTVTYRDGQTVYAFGHELDGAGRRSLLLQDAYVYDVVNNPNTSPATSYKLASPGHTVGALTSDTPNAVIGIVGAPPRSVPVHVTARDNDTGATVTLDTQVADETDIGQPLGQSLVSLIAPLAVAQAATDVYSGAPANESGRMCLTVTLRESRRPLRFCNRYVLTGIPGDGGLLPPGLALIASSDATTALGLIDQVGFAALHVTRVRAQIEAERGLREAEIVSAHAPSRVRAGAIVRVRLLARVFRGRLRLVSVELRIPRHAHGRVVATISAPPGVGSSSGPGALANALVTALFGGNINGGPPAPPNSIRELRTAFAAVASYDGLTARFRHHKAQRVYRNPELLITGSTKLVFHVAR
jgi:hypothetical protein